MNASEHHETPVTRREFNEALDKIGARIEELFRAKQISWPLIIAILALVGGVLGFGIKNLADVSAMSATVQDNTNTIDALRERTRALESNLAGVRVENETQNRWTADVANLEHQYLETLIRVNHPQIPARTYWPLSKIGDADPTNGAKH